MEIPLKRHASSQKKRLLSIDVLRGYAIILMILFHFGYDLTVFGYADYDTNVDLEWRLFRAVIVSGFLLAVGMSSYMAYSASVPLKKLTLSVGKLLIVALFISLSSYYMYPNHWVYFGIIHFIALALPLSLLFLRRPVLSCFLSSFILLGYFSGSITMNSIWQWSVINLGIPKHTMDLVSFTPWFAVVLLGGVVMHYQRLPQVKVNSLTKYIAFLGQHSLLIYLLHQPLMFAGFYLVDIFE